ncbi:MAG: rod shape-determining protein MreC [Candidatus Andeanibacterium colombiense]|uniref:Cell shape-determining protein MreC n=1 Tax=Candidatus Andeanibacterium colombiense TaxID=3121345 RepID=A0AAJ6BN43_9SPHN|nr:MAG: rod shape-determining protein MreC [Sphingomonadaceae bacterium]
MPPPTHRRSTYSKKAQFSVFTGYLVAALGAALGAVLLLLSFWKPDAMNGIRGEATDIVAPVGEGSALVRNGGQSLWQSVSGYWQAGYRNAQLEREVKEAHVRLAQENALAAENARLKALLGLQDGDVKPVAYARLIGSSSASTRRLAYLSAGSDRGVRPGMPVRSQLGLVGRVLEVGDSASRVLLLTDGASMVPVRRAKDDVVAFAEGRADGSLNLRLINLGINPLKKGDVFVTSGSGGLFRPGIAVAVVERVTRDGAIALPTANPAATIHVAIDPAYVPEAQTLIDRPAPAANPTTTGGDDK